MTHTGWITAIWKWKKQRNKKNYDSLRYIDFFSIGIHASEKAKISHMVYPEVHPKSGYDWALKNKMVNSFLE